MKIKPYLSALLLSLSISVYGQETVFSCGDFDYEINSYDSTAVTLIAFDGTLKGDIVIPDSVTNEGKTYAVKTINSMGDNPKVLSIRFPKTVTSISSLSSLTGLENVYVDEGNPNYQSLDGVLVNSYDMSIYGIPRGRRGEFKVPDGVKIINTDFYSEITKLIVPSSVTYIYYGIGNYVKEFEVAEDNAYFSSVDGMLCSKDGKTLIAYPATDEPIVAIPESIDSIGTYAFQQSKRIMLNRTTPPSIGHYSWPRYNEYILAIYVRSSNLPSYQMSPNTSNYNLFGYDMIIDSLFFAKNDEGSASLVGSQSQSERIEIPQTITDENNNAYTVTSIGRLAFYDNRKLQNVILPETLKAIGDSAFCDTDLQEITLPASLTEIGDHAFYASSLTDVYALCSPIVIGSECFYFYYYNAYTLYIPSEFEEQYRTAIGWKDFDEIIANDAIQDYFFLRKIGDDAMSVIKYTGSQTDITIPNEVTVDGKTYRITAIGERVFNSMSLTSVILPKWLEEIGEEAFSYNDFTTIDFPSSLKTIGYCAFERCPISRIDIPSSIETIGGYAFYNYNLITVTVNNDTPCALGSSAFYSNSGLKILVPPSSVKAYKTAANWQNYSSYMIGVDAIVDDMAYQKLDDNMVALSLCLKSFNKDEYNKLTIPEQIRIDGIDYRVSTIGEKVFYYASNLNELTIPETIDTIGDNAFNSNTILRMKSLTPPKVNSHIIYSYPKMVIVPFEVLDTYKTANYWSDISSRIVAYNMLMIIDGVAYIKIDESHAAVCRIITMPENQILEIPERIEASDKKYTISMIGSGAFNGVSGKLLILPQTIDSIASNPSYGNFTLVYLKSATPPRLSNNNNNNVYVPSTALNRYQNDKKWVPYDWYKQYIHGTDGIINSDSVIYNVNNTTRTAEICIWMKANTGKIEVPSTVILDEVSYSITALMNKAFDNYDNIKSFRIPQTVTTIGDYVIPSSSNLIVIAEASTPPTIGYHYYVNNLTLHVRSASYDSYSTADVWKNFGNIVAIDGGDNQFYYAKAGEGKAIVIGVKTPTNNEFEIPDTVIIDGETLQVTELGSELFMNNRNIQKIQLPNTIESINDRVFFGSSLQQITIPASVKKIGIRALGTNVNNYFNSSLQTIKVRAGNKWFMQRKNNLLLSKDGKILIQSARYGGGLSRSWYWRWEDDDYYEYYVENNPLDGVEKIATGALDGNPLSKIKIPSSLTDVDASAFMNMGALRELEVDTLNEKLCSIDGILFSKDTTLIIYFPYYKIYYSDYQNYELPEKVKNIGKYAFYNSRFESLTLSDSLKTIADSAFYYEYSYYYVNSLILMNNEIAKASETAFTDNMYQNTILYIPMGTQKDYLNTSPWSKFRSINSAKLAEEDFLLLKAFYEEMGNGEGWYRQWTFGATAEETRITRGIRMVDDHIYSLDLSDNGLKGGLSDKLFKLPRLEILNLSNNKLNCPIDSVLNEENIDNYVLRELNISSNQLTGNIGAVGKTLKRLYTLNASNNKLSQVTPMLPTSIYDLSLNNQEMDTLDYKNLLISNKEYVEWGQPNLLFYDHSNRHYSANRTFTLQNIDGNDWRMQLTNTSTGLKTSQYSYNYLLYNRPNGDKLKLSSNYSNYYAYIRMLFDPGDVNFDTNVNVGDLQLTVNYSVSETPGQLFNFTAADIQVDDWINVQDVVSMVNILLNQQIPPSNENVNESRLLASRTEDAEAALVWRGNQLILKSDCDVAAMDIAIENAKDVKWLLDDVDYDYSVSKQSDYVRIIHYSMSGKEIKAGETVVADVTGHDMNILKADLVDKDSHPVNVICKGMPTAIEDASVLSPHIRMSANITGVNIMTNQPMYNIDWVVYGLNGNLLGKGNTSLASGFNTLKCNLAGESRVVVRLSNDNVNITKKVSIIK